MANARSRLVPERLRREIRVRIQNIVRSTMAEPLENLQARLDALSGVIAEVQSQLGGPSASLNALEGAVAEIQPQLVDLRTSMLQMQEKGDRVHAIVGCIFDRIPELRSQLLEARVSAAYSAAFRETEPLISVRVATYNRGDVLFERTIPSVLAQTYRKFEVIIVGDGCNDNTAARVERLGDPRIGFVNMPHRGVYPDDPVHRWMVAGSPAMNLGAQLAKGTWIAPIDDDDEFSPDHLELLLAAALAGRFEVVYGKMLAHSKEGLDTVEVGQYPPVRGTWGLQAAMYMATLRFFEYDTRSWVQEEPGDWNLCRRMLEAGIRFGFVDRVVTNIYPHGIRAA
ncbi:MAG: glycosyltransferase [Candidatus Dormiibacterota bacterium]